MSTLMYIFISGLVLLLTYIVNNHRKNRRFWTLLDDFYGDKPIPIFGNALQLGSNSEVFTKRALEIFERAGHTTYKFTIGNQAYVNLCTPETVEVLLSNTKENSKMIAYSYFKEWLGDGLLLSTGAKWRTRRKIITPTFHFKILEQFVKVFNDNGDILVEQISKEQGKLFDIYPYINVFALDVICEAAMGVSVNAQKDKNSEYVKAVHSMCILLNKRFRSPFKKWSWIYKLTNDYVTYSKNIKILHKLTNSVIQARRAKLKDQIEVIKNGGSLVENSDEFIGKRKKVAFLDLLLLSKLADGSFLSDEDVREETDTFMFEGHDTTTSAIAFALYEMARNPDIQERVHKEISNILGEDFSNEITHENLQELKYMEMVIKETLRLYPSVPKYGRLLNNDLELPEGKIIPAGCTVIIDALGLGRNPRYFKNPEKFDPERFSPENSTNRHPYLFVPFSAGLRNCIGQKFAMLEMKTVLSKILMKYEVITGGDEVNVRLASEVILKTENGVQIYIKERKR